MNDSSCIFEIIYNTIQQSHNTMSVKTLGKMAGVSRSGYYAWIKAAPARKLKEQQDHDDFDLILTAYKMHGYTKGAKGICMSLLHMDPPVIMNLKKIQRLMDKFNLSCPYRGGRTLTGAWLKPLRQAMSQTTCFSVNLRHMFPESSC